MQGLMMDMPLSIPSLIRHADRFHGDTEIVSRSVVDLENIAMSHPAVREAAVIGVPHPKWDERPLLVVVRKPGAAVDRASLLDFYRSRTARWCIPDDVVFVDELPHAATGKLSKRTLRESVRDYAWPAAAARGD